jgi:hypothetical protein
MYPLKRGLVSQAKLWPEGGSELAAHISEDLRREPSRAPISFVSIEPPIQFGSLSHRQWQSLLFGRNAVPEVSTSLMRSSRGSSFSFAFIAYLAAPVVSGYLRLRPSVLTEHSELSCLFVHRPEL